MLLRLPANRHHARHCYGFCCSQHSAWHAKQTRQSLIFYAHWFQYRDSGWWQPEHQYPCVRPIRLIHRKQCCCPPREYCRHSCTRFCPLHCCPVLHHVAVGRYLVGCFWTAIFWIWCTPLHPNSACFCLR